MKSQLTAKAAKQRVLTDDSNVVDVEAKPSDS